MNSVVAEWLRPWEFVSRASCWRGQNDVFGAHGKVKPAGLPSPSDDGGHAMHASLDREIGGIEVVGVQAAGAIRVFGDGGQIGRVAPAFLCVVSCWGRPTGKNAYFT